MTPAKASDPKHDSDAKRQPKPAEPNAPEQAPEQAPTAEISPRTLADPRSITPSNLLALQGVIGNRAVQRLIQRKLTVGAAHDACEQEADRIADQVVSSPALTGAREGVQRAAEEQEVQTKPLAADSKSVNARAEPLNSATPGPSVQPRIQRLMTLKDFSKATSGMFGGRSKTDFVALDQRLDEYDKFGWSEKDVTDRNGKLDEIENAANLYAGKATKGVTELIESVRTERKFVKPLAEAIPDINGKTNMKTAIKKLFQSQDAFLVALRQGHPVKGDGPDYDGLMGKAQRALNDLGTRDSVMQDLIKDDLQVVENIAADTNTHPLMRQILQEVLANKNQIYFQETKGMASGAVLAGEKDRNKGITEKYRLDMQMNQKQGSPERLSSLVHEMTHISVQEIFANTPIHLAFKKSATDREILDLSSKRTAQCRELKSKLEATRKGWSPGQYGVLEEKVTYPIEGKNTLGSYAKSFKNKGEITQTEQDKILSLEERGANNTLIEFDTVINQMMFLMTTWNVPEGNKFYAKLREVAQEAYTWRHS